MSRLTFITKETDVHAFHAGIFFSEADLISPVSIYPSVDFQTLENFHEESKAYPSQWMTYAGPAGIGQYSLKKGPAGALAKVEVHFRHPSTDEMKHDFNEFGEQVLGPPVKEVPEEEKQSYKNNAIFKLWGDDHYFMGPSRIVKSVFLTRIFPGDLPEDISRVVQEVDELSEKDEMIVPQGYQFLHAKEGKMHYMPLGKKEDYRPSKLDLLGFVEINNGSMTYYPKGDKNHPIDFTVAIRRGF